MTHCVHCSGQVEINRANQGYVECARCEKEQELDNYRDDGLVEEEDDDFNFGYCLL